MIIFFDEFFSHLDTFIIICIRFYVILFYKIRVILLILLSNRYYLSVIYNIISQTIKYKIFYTEGVLLIMNDFFIKEKYVFDESKFKVGYPYEIRYVRSEDPSYGLFIEVNGNGDALFRFFEGNVEVIQIGDYLNDRVTITGPLTITFDACSITITDPDGGSIGIDPNKVPNTIDGAPLLNEPCVDNIRGHHMSKFDKMAAEWAEEERISEAYTFDNMIAQMKPMSAEEKAVFMMKLKDAVDNCKQATNIVKESKVILDEINGYPHAFVEVNQDSTNPYVSHQPSLEERDQFFRDISELSEIVTEGTIEEANTDEN